MRSARTILLFAIAGAAGWAASALICQSPVCRDLIGRAFGRGPLLATTAGIGIYEADVRDGLDAAIVERNIDGKSRAERVPVAEVARALDLLRSEFADERIFAKAVAGAGLTTSSLQAAVTTNLRGRHWMEKQIAPTLHVSAEECRSAYDAQRARFVLPPRYRARHLFIAAPTGTPDELVEERQRAMQLIATRLAHGEDFANLASEMSEDEATKLNGGDLHFFSAWRMPPGFIAEVEKLQIGQISAPIRSHLGFHIVQLTDAKPRTELSFEQVRGEIAAALADDRRMSSVARLVTQLREADFIAPAGLILHP
jgi:parvulin-like peptidyl-prolyl isomerase